MLSCSGYRLHESVSREWHVLLPPRIVSRQIPGFIEQIAHHWSYVKVCATLYRSDCRTLLYIVTISRRHIADRPLKKKLTVLHIALSLMVPSVIPRFVIEFHCSSIRLANRFSTDHPTLLLRRFSNDHYPMWLIPALDTVKCANASNSRECPDGINSYPNLELTTVDMISMLVEMCLGHIFGDWDRSL